MIRWLIVCTMKYTMGIFSYYTMDSPTSQITYLIDQLYIDTNQLLRIILNLYV